MDDVNSSATDERTARVALAAASEPGDTTTGRLLSAGGAVETARLATRSGSIAGPDRASTEAWRRRLSGRLGSGPVQRVIERTHAWMTTSGRPRRCPDRHETIVESDVHPAAVIVTTRCLITAARSRYRWSTRPTTRRLTSCPMPGARSLHFEPLTRATMQTAARFGAEARQRGQPTARNEAHDIDMFMATRAHHLANDHADVLIATTNVQHLTRLADARSWGEIP